MKKHIVFGLATAITLLLCFLFRRESAYHIASILLIFPVVLAVVFYRKRGLVYAAIILLVSLLIPLFFTKDTYTIAQSIVEVLIFFSLAITRFFVETRRDALQSELDVFFEINADMEVLRDPELKKDLWSPKNFLFYRRGSNDPNYCILKFTATEGRYYCDLKTEPIFLS